MFHLTFLVTCSCVCACACDQSLRSEVDARLGAPQILIKQVILYHEVECNYDETRVEESQRLADSPDALATRVIPHTPKTTVRVISQESLLSDSKAINVEWIQKSKSKSQLSLSTLEINVLFALFLFASRRLPNL